MSLVHAALIISRGGIPVVISALVEDCMSLTVANLPVVAAAYIRRLSSDSEGNDQRWSSFKFKTRTMPISTGDVTTTFFSRGAAPGAGGHAGTATELTGTSLERQSKGIGAYSLSSDVLFANGTKMVDGDAEKGHEDKSDVVRIDVLPYPSEQPPKP